MNLEIKLIKPMESPGLYESYLVLGFGGKFTYIDNYWVIKSKSNLESLITTLQILNLKKKKNNNYMIQNIHNIRSESILNWIKADRGSYDYWDTMDFGYYQINCADCLNYD